MKIVHSFFVLFVFHFVTFFSTMNVLDEDYSRNVYDQYYFRNVLCTLNYRSTFISYLLFYYSKEFEQEQKVLILL